jgi:tetratricopeptide (TPR) repeat protein
MSKDINIEKTIFFSYSFNDTEVVDEIDKDFQGFSGINIKRCVRDLEYTDSIKEFMKQVRETDFVFIVVSDAFIKSCNCMYEVTELFKENDFKMRILPIVPYENNDERRAKIFTPEDRAEVLTYWNKRRNELENKLNNIPRESSQTLDDDLKKYREICNIVGEFIDTIADMNYVPLNRLKNDRYKQIFQKIGYEDKNIEFELLLISILSDKEEREIELDKFILRNPDYIGGYYQKGYFAVDEKKYKIGLYYYSKAIQLKPDFVYTYFNRGILYSDINKYDESISDYSKAIQLKDDFADAYYNRGNIYSILKQYDAAIADYTKAIKLKPDYAEAYNNRGIKFLNLKKYNEAIVDYNKVIELRPDLSDAYEGRGLAYFCLHKYNEVLKDYSKVIELKPNYSVAYSNMGHYYLVIEDLAKAKYYFKKSLDFDSKSFAAMLGLSVLYYLKKRNEETKHWMKKAIGIEPSLKRGMEEIEKLENEKFIFNFKIKETLKKIFELLGK